MSRDKILRVPFTLVVEIDRAAWALNYGSEETAREIRDIVKDTATELVREHFARVGVLSGKVV